MKGDLCDVVGASRLLHILNVLVVDLVLERGALLVHFVEDVEEGHGKQIFGVVEFFEVDFALDCAQSERRLLVEDQCALDVQLGEAVRGLEDRDRRQLHFRSQLFLTSRVRSVRRTLADFLPGFRS